ncbi:hypothetical protein Acr_00g0032100 [Actinidia rufa]|uniref:Uncharacterized protein n=1 Tax=Actinidia rufa TaxID=165716 RepID=A0A7J0DFI2_9ERIC|nr:hypothetical protein Acr_00g0032100 [Actinidia rufa]
MEPSEKFNLPLKFNMYGNKSDSSQGEKCSEKLALVSYKLGLTIGEKLWDDFMLNPLADLRDLMMRVKLYAQLEGDVRIRDNTYYKKPLHMGGDLKKRNQRWKCPFHKKKRHRTENYGALKSFLDQQFKLGT